MRARITIRPVNVLLMLGLILSFCSNFALSQEKKVLNYWGMVQAELRLREAQEDAVADFEKMHPDIKIKVTVFPYPVYRDKLLVAATAGAAPEIFVVDQIWNPEFAAAGFVIPLDDYIARSGLSSDTFFKGAWDSCVHKGKVWGIPFDVGVWSQLFYNRDMFREVGLDPNRPPVYWDEYLDYGKKLTRDVDGDGTSDQWGSGMYGGRHEGTICQTDAFIFSNGGSILSEDFSRCVLGDKASVEAMEFYKKVVNEMSPPGATARTPDDAVKLFSASKIAMHLQGSWVQSTITARAPEMDWAVSLLPKPRRGESVGTYGGWNLVIYQKSKYKDAAWEFIKYWSSKGINEKVIALVPANKESADIFLALKKRFPKVIFEQLRMAHPRPIFPGYPQISEVQRDAIQYLLLGTKPIQQILDDAAAEINELL